MTISEHVVDAMTSPVVLSKFQVAAQGLGVDLDHAAHLFAKDVAIGYLHGRYTWEQADRAINELNTAFICGDLFLTDIAWDIYLAFDAGEFIHNDGDPAMDGEPRTKALLAELSAAIGA